jgi:hypothetical protein
MSSPDADQRGTGNYNKRIDHGNLHNDFSFVVISAIWERRAGMRRQKQLQGLPAFIAGYTMTIGGGTCLTNPTLGHAANFRGTSLTLSCYPNRAEFPGLVAPSALARLVVPTLYRISQSRLAVAIHALEISSASVKINICTTI